MRFVINFVPNFAFFNHWDCPLKTNLFKAGQFENFHWNHFASPAGSPESDLDIIPNDSLGIVRLESSCRRIPESAGPELCSLLFFCFGG